MLNTVMKWMFGIYIHVCHRENLKMVLDLLRHTKTEHSLWFVEVTEKLSDVNFNHKT